MADNAKISKILAELKANLEELNLGLARNLDILEGIMQLPYTFQAKELMRIIKELAQNDRPED